MQISGHNPNIRPSDPTNLCSEGDMPTKSQDPSIKSAQAAIKGTAKGSKKNLLEHIITVLKNFLDTIVNYFIRCFKPADVKKENSPDSVPQNNVSTDVPKFENLKNSASLEPNRTAMTWMYQNPKLNEDEVQQKHEELLKIINEILPTNIDKLISYNIGKISHTRTLLLHAVIEIKNENNRFEIAKILLEKGASSTTKGSDTSKKDLIFSVEDIIIELDNQDLSALFERSRLSLL